MSIAQMIDDKARLMTENEALRRALGKIRTIAQYSHGETMAKLADIWFEADAALATSYIRPDKAD
jgi:hypothetical protein